MAQLHFKRVLISISLLIGGLCVGCRERDSDFSTDPPGQAEISETNAIRKKLGIREIKSTWDFYGREFGVERWTTKNGLTTKTVRYDDKEYMNIIAEEDHYYSGRMIPCPDGEGGPVDEKLNVVYHYPCGHVTFYVRTDIETIQEQEDKVSLEIYPNLPECSKCRNSGFRAQTNEETLKVVDKILEMWGLDRLD